MVHTNFSADNVAAQVALLASVSPVLGALLGNMCAEFGEVQADASAQSQQVGGYLYIICTYIIYMFYLCLCHKVCV